MTAYEQILEMFPLVSYEEDRKECGHMTLVSEAERRSLAEGVTYSKRLYRRGNGKDVWVYIAEIARGAKVQTAVSACPLRTIKPVISHAAEYEGKVLLAMNAGFFHFFNNGDLTPYGIQVMRGVTLAEPGRDKPQYSTYYFGVTKDGTPIISDADEYYNRWKGNLECAVGGGLMLIRGGEITLHQNEATAPRTAVAIAEDGTVIFLCADGRSKVSAGLSYADTIDIFLNLGYRIRDLLNLDGGGSTTLVLRQEDGQLAVSNVPSGPPAPNLPAVEPHGDEQSRPVADAILLVEK